MRHPILGQLLPGFPHDLAVDLALRAFERETLFHREQNLADAEQADHGDQEIESLQQRREAEREAQLAGDRVEADGSQAKAEHHRRECLERRTLAHADKAAECEQVDREEFRWAELQREFGHQRRQERDEDDRDECADERRSERCRQRFSGASLLRKWIAVKGGCHRPGFTGYVEQDRRDRSAEQRSPVDARKHDDRGGRIHRKRQRQQDRHAVGAPQARQHADQHAQQHADHHQRQVVERQGNRESPEQRVQFIQRRSPTMLLVCCLATRAGRHRREHTGKTIDQ